MHTLVQVQNVLSSMHPHSKFGDFFDYFKSVMAYQNDRLSGNSQKQLSAWLFMSNVEKLTAIVIETIE